MQTQLRLNAFASECQKLDWKRHKPECRSPEECSAGGAPRVDNLSTTNSANGFVQAHIIAIRARLRAVAAECRQRGEAAGLHDLVLVVDFEDGAIRGEFTVKPLAVLQRRTWLPKFCYDGRTVMESNVQALLRQVAVTHATLQPNMLLLIVKDLAGGCAICRSQNRACDGTPLFSNEWLLLSDSEAATETARITRVSEEWARAQKC